MKNDCYLIFSRHIFHEQLLSAPTFVTNKMCSLRLLHIKMYQHIHFALLVNYNNLTGVCHWFSTIWGSGALELISRGHQVVNDDVSFLFGAVLKAVQD